MNSVKLVWSTPDIDGLLAYIARVSNPDNQTNPNIAGLLNHMMKEGHASPFEMCNVCFELNTTRDIGRQFIRHKSVAVQEFCISGESKITMIKGKGDSKKITIAELYKQFHSKYWSRSANFARVFDEETKLLTKARVLEVFKTGVKPCFKLTLENGKTIVATKEHKFLTFDGFKPLEELNTDSYIGCNGVHKGKTNVEMRYLRKTARFNRVLSIEPFGEVETYDLEVEHSSHNYVANGMIVHNSQRYQHIASLEQAPLRECRLQDNKNRQNSLENDDLHLESWWMESQAEIRELAESKYYQAIDKGIAKEQARVLLPEGLTSSRIYANGNMRSWIFYLKQRLHPSTQKEHRLLAQEILTILRELAPVTMQAFFGE